jgi:hypothetical protein
VNIVKETLGPFNKNPDCGGYMFLQPNANKNNLGSSKFYHNMRWVGGGEGLFHVVPTGGDACIKRLQA